MSDGDFFLREIAKLLSDTAQQNSIGKGKSCLDCNIIVVTANSLEIRSLSGFEK